MGVERVMLVKQISDIAAKRRYPKRIVPIEAIRKIDKSAPVGGRADWRNVDQTGLPTRPVMTSFW
jgi:hypothetical protein